MRSIKKTCVYLIAMGVVVFTAGSVKAGGVAEEWVRRYNGSGNYDDRAAAIAIDGSGNIYVTGTAKILLTYDFWVQTYATIKYDSAGNELWVTMKNGDGDATAIAVDSSGNIYVTGSTPGGYDTIKYDTNGNVLWDIEYVDCGGSANAIAVDDSGDVYVTGQISGCYFDISPSYATIKYDSAGREKWVRIYNEPGNSNSANAIAIDSSGNVYVIGNGGTIKYDSAGNEIWVRSSSARAIAIDSSGNVYVTGNGGTIKYDSAGNELWVRGGASAIAVDGSGNIYVTGISVNDYATIKYDSNGNELWVARYNGPGNSYDEACAIAVDDAGNIYVTGRSTGSGTSYDYATIKYDPNGNELWVRRYNGPGNSYDSAKAIAVDDSGNIYVTGESYGTGTESDYATIKYSQNPVILTMQTSPPEVNTVIPSVGQHQYPGSAVVNISAQRFVDCPDVYVFDHWEGDVNDPNSANTTVLMDADKTVTAVFADGRQCGDECHPYPSADLDKNCKVNFLDLALFAAQWLECTGPECD
jgi:hypothetical protein